MTEMRRSPSTSADSGSNVGSAQPTAPSTAPDTGTGTSSCSQPARSDPYAGSGPSRATSYVAFGSRPGSRTRPGTAGGEVAIATITEVGTPVQDDRCSGAAVVEDQADPAGAQVDHGLVAHARHDHR
ncbi:MAG: hypothetical protein M3419_05415, partial [Actinomycetota bacterium]|nr:hypothetical protein [Actinomycetota bacterium]